MEVSNIGRETALGREGDSTSEHREGDSTWGGRNSIRERERDREGDSTSLPLGEGETFPGTERDSTRDGEKQRQGRQH